MVAFLVLINPFSALSIYLDLTQDHSTKEKRRIARTAALAVFIVIAVFTLTGGVLLKILGISVGSFQVGGGILVLLIAISMMNGNDNPAKQNIGGDKEEGVVPHIQKKRQSHRRCSRRYSHHHRSGRYLYRDHLRLSRQKLQRYCFDPYRRLPRQPDLLRHPHRRRANQTKLGTTGLTILNRIMGMMLAAVSVEIIVAGLKSIFPQLAG